MDRWLVARVQRLIEEVTAGLEAYDPTTPARKLRDFVVRDLSQWYVRRNRRRFWKNEDELDRESAYATLWEALVAVTLLTAPFTPFLAEALWQNLVRRVEEGAPESVHLADWPKAKKEHLDEGLLRDMAAVIKAVELARSARAKAKVKTRTPLPLLRLVAPTDEERRALEHFAEEIKDELNVKELELLSPREAGVAYVVKPNLPKLGPKYGKKLAAIRKALSAAEPSELAARALMGEAVELELEGGERLKLAPDELLVEATAPEGFAAEAEGGYVAILDTRVSDELVREGLARDLIRLIQQGRKEMDLFVADRIRLGYRASGEYARAIAEHADRIKEETLALELSPTASPKGHLVRLKDDYGEVEIGIERAG